MIAATPYLAEAAATQGDKELPPWCHPRTVTPSHVIDELEYAACLFQRAERAVTAELIVLEASGIDTGGFAARSLCFGLASLSARFQLKAIEAREAHANGL